MMPLRHVWPEDIFEEFGRTAPILAQSNHRIANNLMIIATLLRKVSRQIRSATRTFSAQEVSSMLGEASQRIEMVGRFHRLLAEPTANQELDLGLYLNDVAEAAIDSLSPPGDVDLERASGEACFVPPTLALLIGFIIGELVTNAVKYAHPPGVRGVLKLTCGQTDDQLEITLEDDGAGFPDGFDPDRDGGIGLGIVKLFAEQLDATLFFESSLGGLTVRMAAPAQKGVDLATLGAAGEA